MGEARREPRSCLAIAAFSSKEFVRIKVGIGRPPGRQDPADFVLQPFTPQEEASILPAVDNAADAVEMWISDGIEKTMAAVNGTVQPRGRAAVENGKPKRPLLHTP